MDFNSFLKKLTPRKIFFFLCRKIFESVSFFCRFFLFKRSIGYEKLKSIFPKQFFFFLDRELVKLDPSLYGWSDPNKKPYFVPLLCSREYLLRRPFIFILEKGELIGKKGVTLDWKGRIILESTIFQLEYLEKTRELPTIFSGPLLRIEKNFGNCVCLVNQLTTNYFHWFAEALPRIQMVEEFQKNKGISVKFIINMNPPKFQRETLRFLGIPDSQIVELDSKRATVENHLIPSFRHFKNEFSFHHDIYSPQSLLWLKKRFFQNHSFSKRFCPNVFVSRKKTSARRVMNEIALMRELEKAGFESYCLEDFSLEDQISIFRGATKIVAPHGAGLTNVIFTSGTVFELFPTNWRMDSTYTFFQLSTIFRLKYHLFFVESILDNFDMVVPIDSFLEYFHRINGEAC